MVASRAVFVLLFFFVASLVVSSSTDNDKKEGENPTGSLTTISASEVASHNSPDNCWISFYGKVYDMSKFKHKGPQGVIMSSCGKEATKTHQRQHEKEYLSIYLSNDTTRGDYQLSYKDLAKHKSAWDCWICIYGRCFDFTKFQHYGHRDVIDAYCGKEATSAFQKASGHDLASLDKVKEDCYIGTLAPPDGLRELLLSLQAPKFVTDNMYGLLIALVAIAGVSVLMRRK